MSKAGLIRLVVLVAFFGAVEALCRSGVISPKLVIAPSAMVEAMLNMLGSGEMNDDIRQTLGSVGIAMGLSIVGGAGDDAGTKALGEAVQGQGGQERLL